MVFWRKNAKRIRFLCQQQQQQKVKYTYSNFKMHFKVGMTPTTPTHKMYLRKYFDDFKTRGQKIMILLASSNCNLNLEFLLPLATFFRKCNCNSGAF